MLDWIRGRWLFAQDDVAHTRKVLGSHCSVGAVVISVEEASHASSHGAICLSVPGVLTLEPEDEQQGVDSPIGCEGLAQICNAVTIPVLAKGGINCVNAAQVCHIALCDLRDSRFV